MALDYPFLSHLATNAQRFDASLAAGAAGRVKLRFTTALKGELFFICFLLGAVSRLCQSLWDPQNRDPRRNSLTPENGAFGWIIINPRRLVLSAVCFLVSRFCRGVVEFLPPHRSSESAVSRQSAYSPPRPGRPAVWQGSSQKGVYVHYTHRLTHSLHMTYLTTHKSTRHDRPLQAHRCLHK